MRFDPGLVEVALAFSRRLVPHEEDAQDIAQEALLRLIMYGETIERPIPWLLVVIRRLRTRRARLRHEPLPRVPLVDPWPEVEIEMDARRSLARLSPRTRTALSLSLLGYTERETAERLGCSLKATEKALHKGRRQARQFRAAGCLPP